MKVIFMMSNFKYCPMCGTERDNDSQFCKICNFEFLVGKYVKLDEDKNSNDAEITVEKVSQEEFVESNEKIRTTRDKINLIVAKYLNNELTNQFGESYSENISFDINEYISSSLNSTFDDILDDDYLENLKIVLEDKNYVDSKNIFIQWIGENRGHLPGMILNQYRIPIQVNIDNLEKILNLDLEENENNIEFKNLLKKYLEDEKDFLNVLI